ncbi:MAG: hypothetical protein AAFZ11_12850 [Pseudomonadota bacterium]
MSIIDASLARTSGAADTVLGLARELGMDAAQLESAVMALARTFVSADDTIDLATKRTGLSSEALSKIVAALGGEAALGVIADDLSTGLRGLGQGNFFKELLPFG